MVATVVISTKNRKDELRTAIKSAEDQNVPVEVIVVDDGSSDGTSEMVSEEFSDVRLIRHERSMGLIHCRNRAASLAANEIIFSIDDDADFSSPDIVAQTLKDFEHPRIGAVAIPYLEPYKDAVELQKAPTRGEIWVTDSYIGTAHAVRRDLFLQLGGYREHLVHQGEEMDFCLRLVDTGYVARLGNSEPIRHYESPRRDFARRDFYGRRNDILFAWHNVPHPFLLPHLAATTVNGIKAGFQTRRLSIMLRGTIAGYMDSVRHVADRRSVSRETYRLARRLKKQGPQRLQDIEHRLPPVESTRPCRTAV